MVTGEHREAKADCCQIPEVQRQICGAGEGKEAEGVKHFYKRGLHRGRLAEEKRAVAYVESSKRARGNCLSKV